MLIPGGSADLKPGHPFYDATEYLFKLAIEANDKGDYFPVSLSRTVGLEELVPPLLREPMLGPGPSPGGSAVAIILTRVCCCRFRGRAWALRCCPSSYLATPASCDGDTSSGVCCIACF